MESSTVIFDQILTLLVSSVIVISIFRRLHLPPILGYLTVGVLAGSHGPVWITGFENIHQLSKFGVVFLLFTIGLEFSVTKLISMKKALLGLGSTQVLMTILIGFGIALLCGLNPSVSFIIGAAIALSSTAIISKLLNETGKLHTPQGRLSISVLIFQDLCVIPLLTITSALASKSDGSLALEIIWSLVKVSISFVALIVAGRILLTPIFNEVAKSRSAELFMLAAISVALSAAWITHSLGLSEELGPFLAGVILAGTPYHHQISIDIRPFRDALLGLFFISIGLQVDINVLQQYFWIIAGISAAIIMLKALIVGFLTRFLNQGDKETAVKTGLLLCQGGEFGFILITYATQMNLMTTVEGNIVLLSIIFSMIISLLMLKYQTQICRLITRNNTRESFQQQDIARIASIMKNHVIICGFGRVGQQLARTLAYEELNYTAIDLDAARVNQAALAGENVFFGDATRKETLLEAGLMKAKAIVISFVNMSESKTIINIARSKRPDILILIRAYDANDMEMLIEYGATEVIPETLESSLTLSTHLLMMLGIPKQRVMSLYLKVKRDHYDLMQGFFQSDFDMNDMEADDCKRSQLYSIYLEDGRYAVGKTLGELNLDKIGVKVKIVRRYGKGKDKGKLDPTPDLELHSGDVIVIFGKPENNKQAENLLLSGLDPIE